MKQRRTLCTGCQRAAALACLALAFAVAAFVAPATPAWADRDGKIARGGDFDLYWHSVGKGEPVVLLSGGPGMDAEMLRPVADELGREYECVLLEQRGTGRSRLKAYTPQTASLKLYVEDLEALRESLHQSKLTLLGNSWGMILALAYGAAHPDRVRAIVTMGSGPVSWEYFGEFNDNVRIRLWPDDLAALQQAGQIKDGEKREEERLRAIIPGYFFNREKGVRYAQALRFDGFNYAVNGVVMGGLRRDRWDLRPGLRRISAPVLLLQGREDPAGEANLYETKLALPNARMIFFDRCGHLPWLEQPDRFYRACRDFLAQVYGTGGVVAKVGR